MNRKYNIRHLILASIFIAIGICLPMMFHSIPKGGNIFLPMHLPAMVVAFFLPCSFAFAVGFLTPILSSLMTGMPMIAPVPIALILACEIGTYAFVIAALRKIMFKRQNYFAPLLAVLPALIIGRAISAGLVFLLSRFFGFDMLNPMAFVWGATVTGVLGIISQVVLIPPLYHLVIRTIPGWNGQERLTYVHKKNGDTIK